MSEHCKAILAHKDGKRLKVYECAAFGMHDAHKSECGKEWVNTDPATTPVTRADFDRLERKVDELSARLDKRDAEASDFVRKSSDMSMSAGLLLKTLGIPMPNLSVTVTNAPS
jgi:hypothetical protein